MTLTERIVLGLSFVCFVVVPIIFLIRYLLGRKIWKWPKGQRIIGTYEGYTAHFIHKGVTLEFSPAETARRAALAAWCLGSILGHSAVPKEFVVHVLDDQEYDKTYDTDGNRTAGRLLSMERKAGSDQMHLVVCRGSYFGTTPTTGSLVVHELLHASLPETEFVDRSDSNDRDHSDPRVWSGPIVSVESKTFALFVEKVSI